MIAVDWGTTSFRAYRLAPDGRVMARRSAAAGLRSCGAAFEQTLVGQLDGWDDPTIVLAGMIGSRSGWREVPYVRCPAGTDEIVAGMHEIDDAAAFAGRRLFIAPGVAHVEPGRAPEVMRGEESQVVGLLDETDLRHDEAVCLPGTHSKWVRIESGRIVSLRTAMTGELYALLRHHSLLASNMPSDADGSDDFPSFARGFDASDAPGGLAHHLFGVRTLGLFGQLDGRLAPSYLSGLLIGHELRGMVTQRLATAHLIGSTSLTQRYARALRLLGVRSESHDEALSAAGLRRLALARQHPP